MRYGNIVVNILTVMIVFATCAIFGLVAALFVNPYIIPFNPYQPPTPVAILVLPSPTATSTISLFPTLPAAFTPTATLTATRSATATPAPTEVAAVTLEATETPTETDTPDLTQIALLTQGAITATNTPPPSNTPTITPTASKTRSAFPFTVQGGGPTPIQNFANSAGCNWMGIGGQAFDLTGNPIPFLVVHLEGGGINQDAITGTKTAYGAGGYEFFLNNRPVQTTGEYTVQLLDQNGAVPLSDIIVVNTFADCSKNLLLINFVQNH